LRRGSSALEPGDIVTWLLDGKLPHIGIISSAPPTGANVVHNIGLGAQEWLLAALRPHRAVAHYRWPVEAAYRSWTKARSSTVSFRV
jgi:uncharacterized protein